MNRMNHGGPQFVYECPACSGVLIERTITEPCQRFCDHDGTQPLFEMKFLGEWKDIRHHLVSVSPVQPSR